MWKLDYIGGSKTTIKTVTWEPALVDSIYIINEKHISCFDLKNNSSPIIHVYYFKIDERYVMESAVIDRKSKEVITVHMDDYCHIKHRFTNTSKPKVEFYYKKDPAITKWETIILAGRSGWGKNINIEVYDVGLNKIVTVQAQTRALYPGRYLLNWSKNTIPYWWVNKK